MVDMKTPPAASGLALARQAFCDKDLRFPPLPESLAQRLERIDDWIFSTRTPPWWPHEMDDYVLEAKYQPVEDYALLAYVGRGATPTTLCYYVVHQQLRLFLQIFFDTPPASLAEDIRHIASVWQHLERLFAARDEGLIGPDEKLTIVSTDTYGTRYWFSGAAKPDPRNSRRIQNVIPRILKLLKQRAAKQHADDHPSGDAQNPPLAKS